MAGLLDFLGSVGSTPPAYMEGLLGQDQMDKLKRQATTTGLANMVLGYLAAPKNQNLGLGRILGGAVQAGMQGAQGVYSGALSDYETQQKIEEMKRQQEARKIFEAESKNVLTTTPAQYQTIATSGGYEPQQPSADQLSPNFNLTKLPDVTTQVQTAPARQSLNQDALMKLALSGDPRAKVYVETLQAMKDLNPVAKPRATQFAPNGQLIYSDTGEPVTSQNFSAPKEAPSTELDKYMATRNRLFQLNPNDPNIKIYDDAINKLRTFAPTPMTTIQNFVPAGQALQKSSAEALIKNYETLQNVPQTIATMEQAKKLVPSAINFTGSLGEQKLQFAKFFNNNFGTNIDTTGIQSAEQLRSALFTNVMDNLKKMDASPSQQQQQVMSKAFGTLETDPKSLPLIIDIYENILKQKVNLHNSRVKQIGTKIELPYDLNVTIPETIPTGESSTERAARIKRERKGG
jgi:hypothetical protein